MKDNELRRTWTALGNTLGFGTVRLTCPTNLELGRRDSGAGAARLALYAATFAFTIGVGTSAHSEAPAFRTAQSTMLQSVLEKGKIRCGYITYAPYGMMDSNSKKLTGISVEAMEAIGKKLDLKIEWAEEVGYGSIFEGLDAGRYDALCTGVWQNSTRGKKAYFTAPLLFNPIRVWVRAGEANIKSLSDLDAADVRVAVQDGAIEDIIAQTDFPKAKRVSIPQLNPWPDNLLNIISNKADVTFAEPLVITPFLEKNPGSLRELVTARPLRVFGVSIPIKLGEAEFKSALDSAIVEIQSDGTMEAILKKYEKAPGELLRVARPYEEPKR